MEQKTLTRNESADRVQKVCAVLVENAPESTQHIKDLGASDYIDSVVSTLEMHTDHYEWLLGALGSEDVLVAVDNLADVARAAAGYEALLPWRN